MLYRIITEWWKPGSSRDLSSWRSRSKQLKGRWKFSFKNTHSCLQHIDLEPLPSTTKVISLIDSGRNTLFSCHSHHNGSLLRVYGTYRERIGRNVKSLLGLLGFEITIHWVTYASHQSRARFPFRNLKFPSITKRDYNIKRIKSWTRDKIKTPDDLNKTTICQVWNCYNQGLGIGKCYMPSHLAFKNA